VRVTGFVALDHIKAGAGSMPGDQVLSGVGLVALDPMPIGIVILDDKGVVMCANPMALNILGAGEGIHTADGKLVIEQNGVVQDLHEIVTDIHKPEKNKEDRVFVTRIVRSGGKRPLTILAAPVEPDGNPDATQKTLLYIGDPDYPLTFSAKRIAKLYGLSRAESRVAALLASGYRLEQTAEILGVAYETARKHLKGIFGKMGCYRQAELVRILVTGPAALSI